MSSPFLAITHIAASQNQKEVTANAAFDALDVAENGRSAIANTDADQTLTQAQLASGGCIVITGAITANRHINLPASVERNFIFQNATTGGFALIVQVTGAPGATVSLTAAAGLVDMYSDGTNVYALTGGSSAPTTNFAPAETPSGTINGTNASFTLAHTPNPPAGLLLFKNGRLMMPAGVDYTLAGNTITYATASIPQAGATPDVHIAWYWY